MHEVVVAERLQLRTPQHASNRVGASGGTLRHVFCMRDVAAHAVRLCERAFEIDHQTIQIDGRERCHVDSGKRLAVGKPGIPVIPIQITTVARSRCDKG